MTEHDAWMLVAERIASRGWKGRGICGELNYVAWYVARVEVPHALYYRMLYRLERHTSAAQEMTARLMKRRRVYLPYVYAPKRYRWERVMACVWMALEAHAEVNS